MRIALLSPYGGPLMPALGHPDDTVIPMEKPIFPEWISARAIDFVVSYGYRHILGEPTLKTLPGAMINLHISWLPWNRGSDPNFWAHYDDTPHGVTIHKMAKGLDTGEILVQRRVEFAPGATLATSYGALRNSIEALFAEKWPDIRAEYLRNDCIPSMPQRSGGSYHRAADKELIFATLPRGWDTPIETVRRMGAALR